ncbi:MAG: nucleotide exchange factor GrpE [Rikenellaceae bacterium]|nr:nucleotide exchange factor GrpE [Rikenellaceae bacterium]
MSKNKVEEKETYNEAVSGDEGFTSGEAYPNCEGAPCDNMSAGDDASDDNVADRTPDAGAAAVRDEAGEWKDKYMRLSAEFDNYRKRTLREKMELIAAGGEDVIKPLLAVVDDIDRAIDAMSKTDDAESVRQGVVLIAQKLNDMLASKGVKEIEAVGLPLDTDLHEAVARFAAGEEKKGLIIDVVQKGYKLKDKVIRYAKVVVGE